MHHLVLLNKIYSSCKKKKNSVPSRKHLTKLKLGTIARTIMQMSACDIERKGMFMLPTLYNKLSYTVNTVAAIFVFLHVTVR